MNIVLTTTLEKISLIDKETEKTISEIPVINEKENYTLNYSRKYQSLDGDDFEFSLSPTTDVNRLSRIHITS